MDPANERRERERIPYAMEVELVAEDGTSILATTHDISLKGLFLETRHAPPLGSRCEVRLEIGGPRGSIPLRVEGVVARVSDEGVALEFDDVTCEAFASLRRMSPFRSESRRSMETGAGRLYPR